MTLRDPFSFTVDRHERFRPVAEALNIAVHGDNFLLGKVKLDAAEPPSPRKCTTTGTGTGTVGFLSESESET